MRLLRFESLSPIVLMGTFVFVGRSANPRSPVLQSALVTQAMDRGTVQLRDSEMMQCMGIDTSETPDKKIWRHFPQGQGRAYNK